MYNFRYEVFTMRLEYLKYLLDLADTHSLTQTAQNYYISQQNLFKNIKSLEKELGWPLYYVKNKKCFLTPAGEIVSQFASTVVAESHKMNYQLENLLAKNSDATSKISILSFSAISNFCITIIIDYFKTVLNAPAPVLKIKNVQSFSAPDVIASIQSCDADMIFLSCTVSSWNSIFPTLSPYIKSYSILADDYATTCYSKKRTKPVSKEYFNEESFGLYSCLLNPELYSEQNIAITSTDTLMVQELLMRNQMCIVMPNFLTQKYFSDDDKYKILSKTPQYPMYHICLAKKNFSFLEPLMNYIRINL